MRSHWCESAPAAAATVPMAREAILDAAGELLVTRGLVGMTIEAVARRAHVSNETVERWWPNDEALAIDVLPREWAALVGCVTSGACELAADQ